MKYPNLIEEKKLWKRGYRMVAGLDEAGRGCVAGPVVAAAVVVDKFKIKNLKLKILLNNIRDSKKLASKKREDFYRILTVNSAVRWGIGVVSEKTIDRMNIKNAAELAMEKALRKLNNADYLIIDGNHIKNSKLKAVNHKLIVKADERVFSCAAASIIAKVTRDKLMQKCHKKFPQYGFDKHKGYLTALHMDRLEKFGPEVIHRKSFAPFCCSSIIK